MSTVPAAASSNEFVDFWNDVLVPKFIKYRHIMESSSWKIRARNPS